MRAFAEVLETTTSDSLDSRFPTSLPSPILILPPHHPSSYQFACANIDSQMENEELLSTASAPIPDFSESIPSNKNPYSSSQGVKKKEGRYPQNYNIDQISKAVTQLTTISAISISPLKHFLKSLEMFEKTLKHGIGPFLSLGKAFELRKTRR